MLITKPQNLDSISSLKEKHSFSALKVSFGFVGKNEKNKISELNFLTQVHDTDVLEAGTQTNSLTSSERPSGDGIYTKSSNIKIAVRTADCLPLLICDLNSSFVMALHAGWKGLAAGIIDSALKKAKDKYKIEAKNLAIFMGPCLSQENFEVGPEVIEAFDKKSKNFMSPEVFQTCYKAGKKDRSFLDLKSYAFYSLLSQKVLAENITAYNTCTLANNDLWFSYRKEAPLKEHNWNWISLN